MIIKALKNSIVLPITWVFLLLLSILLYLLSHLPRVFSGRYYHFLSRFWCKVFVRGLDVDLKQINKNKKPLPKHFILIANHPSVLEDFAIPALFDIYPLAKAAVRDWMILGRISDYAGTIYVVRDNADSRHAAKKALYDAVESGKNIVIFPEGGCKGSRIYKEFQKGAFDISIKTGVPILPVFLHYVDQNTFEWTDQTLVQKLWQIFKSNHSEVNYYVHDAIAPNDFNNAEKFATHVHSKYMAWQDDYL